MRVIVALVLLIVSVFTIGPIGSAAEADKANQSWIEKLFVQNYHVDAVLNKYTHNEHIQMTPRVKTRSYDLSCSSSYGAPPKRNIIANLIYYKILPQVKSQTPKTPILAIDAIVHLILNVGHLSQSH